MAWPETVLTSIWCLVARELDEPVRGRKANDGRAICWCAFGCSEQGNSPPRQSTGCRCVSRRWVVAGVQWPACVGRCGDGTPGVSSLLKCSSRVRGNLHARFLGGGGRVTVSCYPAYPSRYARRRPVSCGVGRLARYLGVLSRHTGVEDEMPLLLPG